MSLRTVRNAATSFMRLDMAVWVAGIGGRVLCGVMRLDTVVLCGVIGGRG